MIKVCVWTVCLFSALTVGKKSLSSTGYVGGNVTFHCSDWDGYLWSDVKSYVKYICNHPCSDDKHVIMTVKPGKSNNKDRIYLYNNGGTLSVTFTDLKKSDSNTYYCGLKRWRPDIYIRVNLKVIDGVSPVPKTTVSVWSSSAVSSTSSDISSYISTLLTTHQSTAATASEAQEEAGSVLYLIIGFIVIITTLTLLLCLMMKMKQRKKKVSKSGSPVDVIQQVRGFYRRLHVLKPHRGSFYRHMASYSLRYTDEEETTQNVTLSSTPQFKLSLCPTLNDKIDMFTDSYFKETDYAEIGLEDLTERSPASVAHTETLYANYSSHQDTGIAAQQGRASHIECIYSVAKPAKKKPELAEQPATNDSIYSLAQPAHEAYYC